MSNEHVKILETGGPTGSFEDFIRVIIHQFDLTGTDYCEFEINGANAHGQQVQLQFTARFVKEINA